jgi:hypothetical protein
VGKLLLMKTIISFYKPYFVPKCNSYQNNIILVTFRTVFNLIYFQSVVEMRFSQRDYERYSLLERDAVQSGRGLPTFRGESSVLIFRVEDMLSKQRVRSLRLGSCSLRSIRISMTFKLRQYVPQKCINI